MKSQQLTSCTVLQPIKLTLLKLQTYWDSAWEYNNIKNET